MSSNVLVYEDFGWQRLLPLVYWRPVFQLLCGADELLGTVRRLAEDRDGLGAKEVPAGNETRAACGLWCRPGLAAAVGERTALVVNAPCAPQSLLLNGRGRWRALPKTGETDSAWVGVAGDSGNVASIWTDEATAARFSHDVMLDEARLRAALAGLPRRDVSECVTLFDWPWQLVLFNEEALLDDWRRFLSPRAGVHAPIPEGAYLLGRDAIHVGPDTRIKPCVVIDAEDGPVWIGSGVRIMPHCYVQGPAYIGDGTLLQPGAVVHEGTTIGPVCKIGGEIEASIIQGYSNKQHDGFLGHSYVGSWVNIAADCINSDLKNTYGTVRVPINGREVETDELFVGMLVGDFSKTGINVSFPTGSVVGFCSSVFAPRSPKFVPSFAWINGEHVERFDEQRGLSVARRVMARRRKSLSPAEEAVFLAVRRQALAIEHAPQRLLEAAGE